jgi:hypothetical protein
MDDNMYVEAIRNFFFKLTIIIPHYIQKPLLVYLPMLKQKLRLFFYLIVPVYKDKWRADGLWQHQLACDTNITYVEYCPLPDVYIAT